MYARPFSAPVPTEERMLLQTCYRLDPWKFEPPVGNFSPLRVDLSDQRFSLYIRYIHAREHRNAAQLLIHALHVCDAPDDIAIVFAGEIEDPLACKGGDEFSCFPQGYRDFIQRMHTHIDRLATDLFNVIRWRFGIDGGPLTLASEWASMRWHDVRVSTDILDERGFLNQQVPAGIFTNRLPEVQDISLTGDCADAIEDMFRLQTSQPLYHDLFREAWQNRSDNPRSALVMAIAAAETAFKTTAIDLCDNKTTEWTFENLPSPPLDRMIREYLELLPARRKFAGEVRRPPKPVIATLKQGIELRNKLVHGRNQDVDSDQLDKILIAVRNFLYLLDFYRGHDWAVDRFTPDFRDAMSKESP